MSKIYIDLVNSFTIVKYAGLFCNGQVDRNIIQVALAVGSIIGSFVMNFVSDVKGRRFSMIVALSVGIVGTACINRFIL
jgi:hypothetical protein